MADKLLITTAMTQSPPEGVRGKRILLVEDEGPLREILRHLLREDAHLVIEATNGAQAFALFLSTKFDLVLTDFEMPFVKGNQLAVKIRRVAPRQPILMLTAFDRPAGPNNPVDGVVSKPFDSVKLREAIARVFSHPRAIASVGTRAPESPLNPAAHN